MMDGGMMGGGMYAYFALWGLLALALLVLAVVATVWLLRAMGNRGPADGSAPSTALQRLDDRYAAGDLSREEYLQRREDLARTQP